MSSTSRKHWALVAVALLAAAVFARLGAWQLSRHQERSRRAERLRARLEAPPLGPSGMPGPTAGDRPADSLPWRRVRLVGSYDYGREVLLVGRGLSGTPGVHVATPLRLSPDRAVLVVRGWLPAADGVHPPLLRGRPAGPGGADTAVGVILPGAGSSGDRLRRVRVAGETHLAAARLHLPTLADSLPYDLAPYFVQLSGDPRADSLPAPAGLSEPSSGPHLEYAIQWFAFAAIALVGTGAYLRSELAGDDGQTAPGSREPPAG